MVGIFVIIVVNILVIFIIAAVDILVIFIIIALVFLFAFAMLAILSNYNIIFLNLFCMDRLGGGFCTNGYVLRGIVFVGAASAAAIKGCFRLITIFIVVMS